MKERSLPLAACIFASDESEHSRNVQNKANQGLYLFVSSCLHEIIRLIRLIRRALSSPKVILEFLREYDTIGSDLLLF